MGVDGRRDISKLVELEGSAHRNFVQGSWCVRIDRKYLRFCSDLNFWHTRYHRNDTQTLGLKILEPSDVAVDSMPLIKLLRLLTGGLKTQVSGGFSSKKVIGVLLWTRTMGCNAGSTWSGTVILGQCMGSRQIQQLKKVKLLLVYSGDSSLEIQ